jgi:hypothetical protein
MSNGWNKLCEEEGGGADVKMSSGKQTRWTYPVDAADGRRQEGVGVGIAAAQTGRLLRRLLRRQQLEADLDLALRTAAQTLVQTSVPTTKRDAALYE